MLKKYKEFIAKCTNCGFKCDVNDLNCNDTEEEVKGSTRINKRTQT